MIWEELWESEQYSRPCITSFVLRWDSSQCLVPIYLARNEKN